ncbi:MAG: hypothetical protein WEE66_13760 [Actinomycetota bacterium]
MRFSAQRDIQDDEDHHELLAAIEEVVDARVDSGFHFRTADV